MKKLMCSLVLSTLALAGAELTGKWSGSFVSTNAQGDTDAPTAFMNLKESSGTVTGTAGPSEDHQMDIRNGKLDGQKLTFEVAMPDGGTIRFNLVYDGDTIKGDADGEGAQGEKMKAKLSLKRV